jgi:glycosyltransferase involved in cell wall biosynthesis
MAPLASPLNDWLNRTFRHTYKQASSRLCISPLMEEQHAADHGVRGTVLFPARGDDCPKFDAPPARLCVMPNPFVAAYAGASLNAPGNQELLVDIADVIEEMGGLLNVYGPYNRQDLANMGLNHTGVTALGLLPSRDVILAMRETAQVLIAQMSFRLEDKENIKRCFPSRLADYTATGVPVLIYAPPYSSAIRWGLEQKGVVALVDTRDKETLRSTLVQIASDATLRQQMGANALKVGSEFFSAERSRSVFYKALLSPGNL